MTTSITAFPITAKQIAELTSASSAAGTDYLMAQQGATGTAYRKMTVAQIMASGAAVLASGVTVNAATVPANGMYLPAANTLGLAVNTVGEVQLTASALSPITSDGNALGTTSLMWSDAFLASGAVINFNAGNYTLTHSAGLLTASGPFMVNANAAAPATLSGTLFRLVQADATSAYTLYDTFAGSGYVAFRRAGGTNAAPSATVNNVIIGGVLARGWDTAYTTDRARMVVLATELWASGANGTQIKFSTTANLTTTMVDRLTIDQDGSVLFGVSTYNNILSILPNNTSSTPIAFAGAGSGGMTFASSGGVQMAVTNTASAVNYVGITGGATGNGVTVSAVGANADINLILDAKGAGIISVLDSINLASGKVLQVNSTQVVGPRDTGWTTMTGTPDESTSYATSTVTLAQLAGRVMALQTALTTHGLIGA